MATTPADTDSIHCHHLSMEIGIIPRRHPHHRAFAFGSPPKTRRRDRPKADYGRQPLDANPPDHVSSRSCLICPLPTAFARFINFIIEPGLTPADKAA